MRRKDLLEANHPTRMIEVLIVDRLVLPDDTVVTFFHPEDLKLGTAILQNCGVRWGRRLSRDLTYEPDLRLVELGQREADRARDDD